MSLTSIPDAETNEALAALIAWPRQAWIGLNDRDLESNWSWIDVSSAEFRNWADGEPSDLDTSEDCASVSSDGTWDASRCQIPRSYLCGEPP